MSAVADLAAQRRRRRIVNRLEALPPLPAAAQEVLSIVSGDPRDTSKLEQTIRHDPALAAQILKLANSVAYSPRTPIDTVHRAIVYLGFSEVRDIALGLSIFSLFKKKSTGGKFQRENFWTHAISTAIIARILAVELDEEDAEIFFTAGLLHDLGRIALCICFEPEWNKILDIADQKVCSLLHAEREAGLPHSLIGAWLARSWGLPEVYVDSIATHHLPVSHPKASRTGIIVQLADHISHCSGMGLYPAPDLKRSVLTNYLGLSGDMVKFLLEQLAEMEEVAETMDEMLGCFD